MSLQLFSFLAIMYIIATWLTMLCVVDDTDSGKTMRIRHIVSVVAWPLAAMYYAGILSMQVWRAVRGACKRGW